MASQINAWLFEFTVYAPGAEVWCRWSITRLALPVMVRSMPPGGSSLTVVLTPTMVLMRCWSCCARSSRFAHAYSLSVQLARFEQRGPSPGDRF